MRRIVPVLLLVAALVGCATSESPSSTHGKTGSGAINASWSETVSLSTGTVFSLARYIGSIDNASWDLYAASGSAACTVAVEVSDRYDPATSLATDDTLWTIYAPNGWVAPANLSGAVSNYYIEAVPFSGKFERLKFVCSSGSTTLTLATQLKGG